MKKIGFIDYYLSEWHANNYPAWIKAASERLGYDYRIAYAWAERDTSPIDRITSREWCDKFGVELCGSIEELCEKSDFVLILAPSNPEKHLMYATEAFRHPKRTYIDKTFAPDYHTACEIFSVAEKNGVPFFSTSALRYATETDMNGAEILLLETKGGGSNFEEYIIHQIEMAVKIFGVGAENVYRTEENGQTVCTIQYPGGRSAVLHHSPDFMFEIKYMLSDGSKHGKAIESDFFGRLIEKILVFYESGNVDFGKEQTLEVMKIREALIGAKNAEWIKL